MGSGWSTPRPGRFTPGKDPVPIVYEAGWAPGPVSTGAENLAPTGIRSPDRPASRYTDCAIPANRGTHVFQKSRSHLKILGDRRVTRSKVRTVDTKVFVATVQNLVATATCARNVCTPC